MLGAKRKVVMKPFEVPHTVDGFASLAEKLNGLDGEVRIVMEHTGRYYESFAMSMYRAGFFLWPSGITRRASASAKSRPTRPTL